MVSRSEAGDGFGDEITEAVLINDNYRLGGSYSRIVMTLTAWKSLVVVHAVGRSNKQRVNVFCSE